MFLLQLCTVWILVLFSYWSAQYAIAAARPSVERLSNQESFEFIKRSRDHLTPVKRLFTHTSAHKRTPAVYLVVFGASYCDNGHPREEQYASSLRGPPYAQGRYTNGHVYAERLAHTLSVPLLDYAYGGATASNRLLPRNVPDTRAQIASYLDDVRVGRVRREPAVHLIWIGINSVNHIWREEPERATNMIAAEAAEVVSQATLLATDHHSLPSATFIITLPPLEVLPHATSEAERLPDAVEALKKLQQLTQNYNRLIKEGVESLAGVKVVDVTDFWYQVHNSPTTYGFEIVRQPCLIGSQVCGEPDDYVYFDSLHPSAKMHGLIAEVVLKHLEDEGGDHGSGAGRTKQYHRHTTST